MSDSHDETARKSAGQSSARLACWFTAWRKPIRHWTSKGSTLSIVPAADLDDVAQEVFQRLSRYSEDDAAEHPQGYLFRVAANVAKEWRERQRPHDQNWLSELQSEAADEPQNTTACALVHEHVQAAVRKLPRRQRVVLMLHVNEGLTYKEIADRKGLTYRTVLKDLTRAYSNLRMTLSAEALGEIGDRGAAQAVPVQDSST